MRLPAQRVHTVLIVLIHVPALMMPSVVTLTATVPVLMAG